MDSSEQSGSKARLREEALARRMGEALDRISGRGAGDCPDADVIAAYHERALRPEEVEQWESHFAGCSRCRKVLAVLEASIDAPLAETEIARLGELVAAASSPGDAEAPRKTIPIKPNRLDWRARWLAPALGVAAVLAVWVAMRAPWRTPIPESSGTLVAQAPRSKPPLDERRDLQSSNQISPAESKKAPEVAASSADDRSPAKTARVNQAPELTETDRVTENKSLDQLKAKAAPAQVPSRNEKESPAALAGAASGASTPVAAPPPPDNSAASPQLQVEAGESPVSPPMARAMSNAPARDAQATRGTAATGSASAPRPAPETATYARKSQALSTVLDEIRAGDIEIRAPSGKILWRAGKGGRIERSIDGGRTWTVQSSPSQEDWLAGAAASDTVCWLVGRKGAIARTTDGVYWTQIAPPPQAAAAPGGLPDWTGVTSTSAQGAAITSSDQRRYSTEDGGKTWQPAPDK